MNEELEEQIERKKRYIADYITYSKMVNVDESTKEKTIDLLLKDLAKLMKKRKD